MVSIYDYDTHYKLFPRRPIRRGHEGVSQHAVVLREAVVYEPLGNTARVTVLLTLKYAIHICLLTHSVFHCVALRVL